MSQPVSLEEKKKRDAVKGDVESVMAGSSETVPKDKALELLANHNVEFHADSPEAKRVLRKIDWRIMPMIFTVYLLQLMDKNSLSFAAIMGIRNDANLTPAQYSWLGSIIYFGYLAGEIPATYLMQRVPLAKYVAIMSMLWGIVVAMHAVCHNFASLAAVRFLLGFIEVCVAPASIYITGSWYTKKEQVSRVAIWYTTSGWAAVFGGLFAFALNQAPTFKWQGLFVLYGALTFAVGVICWFWLAVSPTEAAWLTEEEKIIALERVRENKTGTEVWKFSLPQLKEAFCDVRFYMIFLLLVSTGLPNGGITAFGPTIINGFGFNINQTTLLNMGSGSAQVVGTFVALFVAKMTNRTIAGIYTLVLAIVGVVMMLTIPAEYNGARYGGYTLTMQFPICVLFIITFMTAGVGGSTKKFAFGAAYQLGYSVGNIIGPQTFQAYDAPNYYVAKYTMLAFLVFTAILLAAMGLLHRFWNSRRDKEQDNLPTEHVENEEFADLTDFQLRSFRYPL
ncbi:permease of the major facilitator superfamily [Microdochium trichocladiopsis]|uniref:Permease of the major facilitator superfamily n=1 Tax=Microdochium trichocladiopsis TaxID=1682393 RepID=A0A9P8YDK4_9PEZI|nr:permease of the major facilitator superfamily [Microdochium trichocladiopsis]KAH7035965.1 permease of the major facilitator superfamily [Microdochium trichocladiopsis]